jgi:hypothetical protein
MVAECSKFVRATHSWLDRLCASLPTHAQARDGGDGRSPLGRCLPRLGPSTCGFFFVQALRPALRLALQAPTSQDGRLLGGGLQGFGRTKPVAPKIRLVPTTHFLAAREHRRSRDSIEHHEGHPGSGSCRQIVATCPRGAVVAAPSFEFLQSIALGPSLFGLPSRGPRDRRDGGAAKI